MKYSLPDLKTTLNNHFSKAQEKAQNCIDTPFFYGGLNEDCSGSVLGELKICKNTLENIKTYVNDGVSRESIYLDQIILSGFMGRIISDGVKRTSFYADVAQTIHKLRVEDEHFSEKEIHSNLYNAPIKGSNVLLIGLIPYLDLICENGKTRDVKRSKKSAKKLDAKTLALGDLKYFSDVFLNDAWANEILRSLPEEKKIYLIHELMPELGHLTIGSHKTSVLEKKIPEFY